MKNQSKIRFIALVMAVCASLTACGNTADDDMAIVQYTEGKQQEQTTKYDSIYDSMDDYPQNEEQQAVTEAVAETVMVSKFTKASDFNEGYALIWYNDAYYVIDTAGNIVSEFTEKPATHKIYDGGLIILDDESVINLQGEILASKETHNYDTLLGTWHGYIVLTRTAATLEKTCMEVCILNNDGTVKLDWTPQENEGETFLYITPKTNNCIKINYTRGYCKGIYNLETGEYHYTHEWNEKEKKWVLKSEMAKYDTDAENIEYFDYGYVIIKREGQYDHTDINASIYDFNGKLLDKYTGISTGMRYLAGDAFYDGDIVWASYLSGYSNSFYDLRLKKVVTLPFDMEYISDVDMERCGQDEQYYNLELTNKEGSIFHAIADENGNYLVEPTLLQGSSDRILTYNDGVYTTNYKKMCKADGTIIYEGETYGQFIDGYCCMNENSYIDINGNKLEVEFKTE
ncbi:MAG: hypothetical protein IJC04_10540 [Oscillospiraceae bacterium]|nr:hypothetical protein [Oscillospiraceae bacterium]